MESSDKKTVFITGSTDGIGLATARRFLEQGHRVWLHGRNKQKLQGVVEELSALSEGDQVESFCSDMSDFGEIKKMAKEIVERHDHLDALINNAGVFKTPSPKTSKGLDVRFMVNTIAPHYLTQLLLPLLGSESRVINLSSAAQESVDIEALKGNVFLSDMSAYAQSKLALTMWSRHLASQLDSGGPAVIAVNPGSLLGSKMVKEGFGMEGKDLDVGVRILNQLALDERYHSSSGQYFDNDSGHFAPPQADGGDDKKAAAIVGTIEQITARSIES